MTVLSPTAAGAHEQDVVVLATGDVRVPVHPAASAVRARRADQHYRAPAGDPDLRSLIARYAAPEGSPVVSPEEVLVAPGARQALVAVLGAVLGERREVLFAAPYWASYPHLVKLVGGVPVPVPGPVGDGTLDVDAWEARRTPDTAAIIVNSPRNPDGAVIPEDLLRALIEWAGRHGLTVICDEVYRGVPLDGRTAPSVRDVFGELPEHCVVVDGLSKSHALAGLRFGWTIAPADIRARAVAVASHLIGNTSSLVQSAAAVVLAEGEPERQLVGRELTANLDLAMKVLDSVEGLVCPRPEGGIFLFPDVREPLAGLGRLGEPRSEALRAPAAWLKDRHRVAVVDGAAFGAPGYLRLSFALPAPQLTTGLERLRHALTTA
ncbi:aminotransferase class I/II-fold pyridoxal phosphate-dependent enzyme [Streptomyces sp. NPDC008125]|uniref:pyridoxal phosphate-dependent aminotransferase n=1 Tax=Streptomyces sp. NPDC008125 TaxID=3364811 RepID=UPI0036E932BF